MEAARGLPRDTDSLRERFGPAWRHPALCGAIFQCSLRAPASYAASNLDTWTGRHWSWPAGVRSAATPAGGRGDTARRAAPVSRCVV